MIQNPYDDTAIVATLASILTEAVDIETHLHSWERWFGLNPNPTGTSKAIRIGTGNGPFQLDAGNDDWGTWVELFGTDDTPADVGKLFYDVHKMLVIATQHGGPLYLQLACGASGAGALAAGTYTEVAYTSGVSVAVSPTPTRIQTARAPAGDQLWGRTFSPGNASGTIDFYLGMHEYDA